MLRIAAFGRICWLIVLVSGFLPLQGQTDPASQRAAIEMMYPVMLQALKAKAFGRARNICEQAILWEPQNPVHHYNLACIEAQAGRIPQAVGALELAVALGFNDPQHLQADPDLVPLRDHPKYAELVRKVVATALGRPLNGPANPSRPAGPAGTPEEASGRAGDSSRTASTPSPAPLAATARPAAGDAPTGRAPQPPPAKLENGRPTGLYFMTRFWAATRSLEKAVWYFAPDGAVYQNLQSGFSPADLAAHQGPKGSYSVNGDKLEVVWSDGKKTSSTFTPSTSGTGFSWNGGIFSAVAPFATRDELPGTYEGGESLASGGGSAMVSKRLELRADGTFEWSGVSFAGTVGESSRVSVGGTGSTTGRWQWEGLALILTSSEGQVLRRIVFPYDDEKTPMKPDWMFFGGLLYKKR